MKNIIFNNNSVLVSINIKDVESPRILVKVRGVNSHKIHCRKVKSEHKEIYVQFGRECYIPENKNAKNFLLEFVRGKKFQSFLRRNINARLNESKSIEIQECIETVNEFLTVLHEGEVVHNS